MPGDNVNLMVKLIVPVALEIGFAVCDPRGWPHGGRRRHHQDSGISEGYRLKVEG